MTERALRAIELREIKGYNCAQGVVCAYCDLFNLDKETAFRVAEGFGTGMGLMEVCGAVSAAFMLAGMKLSGGAENAGKTKGRTYKMNRAIATKFMEKNGTYICRELKGVEDGEARRSCAGCMADACEIIEELLIE